METRSAMTLAWAIGTIASAFDTSLELVEKEKDLGMIRDSILHNRDGFGSYRFISIRFIAELQVLTIECGSKSRAGEFAARCDGARAVSKVSIPVPQPIIGPRWSESDPPDG